MPITTKCNTFINQNTTKKTPQQQFGVFLAEANTTYYN